MNTAIDMLPGPLHPDLFEVELTPSVLGVGRDEPRWRAEVLDVHQVWITSGDAELLQHEIRRMTERTGADGVEILGMQRQSACMGGLIAVQVGFTYHLDVAADSSHEALAIAEHIACKRWPGSEVVGVDLVMPEMPGGKDQAT